MNALVTVKGQIKSCQIKYKTILLVLIKNHVFFQIKRFSFIIIQSIHPSWIIYVNI